MKVRGSTIAFLALLLLLFCPFVVFGQDSGTPADQLEQEQNETTVDQTKAEEPPPPAERKDPLRWFKTTADFGGQFRILDGERPSKFEEQRQVRRGLLLRNFRMVSKFEDSSYFFRFSGKEISERDQSYYLELGSYNRWRTVFEFQGQPFLYSRGATSLYINGGKGLLLVPDSIQQTLQSKPNDRLPRAVNRAFEGARLIDLRTQRETFRLSQLFKFNDNLSLRLNYRHERRHGARPLGIGSYERVGTARGDTFKVLSTELPEPIDYRTNDVGFKLSYTRKSWGVSFNYNFSQFNNRISSLRFDNPFRFTDMQATGVDGVANRLGFAQGLYAPPPDNHAHTFIIAGYLDLPHASRIASAVGWSFWRQDEPFLPFTANTAIIASKLPPGTKPTQIEALPERSLDGQVDTFFNDHLFTSRLTDSLRVNLHYRNYNFDNNTESVHFPGYAAYSESYWRTSIATRPIESEPISFRKQDASTELDWDITERLGVKCEYDWQAWNRYHRQVGRTNEHGISGQLSLKPVRWFSGKFKYRYSDRTPQSYYPGFKEYKLLRMFDQSKRLRHDVGMQWQAPIKPQFGLSGSFGYVSDDHDQNFLGLSKYILAYGSIDLLYNPTETTTVYVNYAREQIGSTLLTIAKTAVPYDNLNRWDRQTRDKVDTFGAGLTAYLINDKVAVNLQYGFSFADQHITTANPFVPKADSILNASPSKWPDVISHFHELYTDVNYQLTERVALGVRYLYEPYRLKDYSWDNLQPYMFEQFSEENDGRRYLLLDSRYSSYSAHAVGIYVRVTF